MAIETAALHEALLETAAATSGERVETLFQALPDRAERYRCNAAGLTLDFSKHLLDDDGWQLLLELAGSRDLPEAFRDLIHGAMVNTSERRPALHTLLRGTAGSHHGDKTAAVTDTLSRMAALVTAIHDGVIKGANGSPLTDVVNLGIGGSDLGPRLIYDALSAHDAPLRAHFVANIDPEDLDRTLEALNPHSTLFVICSKSFTTEETLTNAARARAWLGRAGIIGDALGQHMIAVTTQVQRAGEWNIPPERCFPTWDWVGGRYSVWSALGISIALALGWPVFESLLAGARQMDTHTEHSAPGENLPMVMALLELWQTQYLGTDTHVVLPYAQKLRHLPDFLQQLTMESNGKRVSPEGEPLSHHSAPVLWGSAGTIGQHSYYQLLHQGTRAFTADIVLPLKAGDGDMSARRALAAHALAQSRALLVGRSAENARQLGAACGFDDATSRQLELLGNHSHSLILMDNVSPQTLGALIAAYEHKTYFLAVLLDLNPFDQWGVELGKEIATHMQQLLKGEEAEANVDTATMAAAKAWRAANPD
ncbi:MAG: glucose-6-phosphate isomerase [Halieaceae bacterium]|nr:glucose-6-phosphate isomerase [Halieaceae bacterium]